MNGNSDIFFTMSGMNFEYNENKNMLNIKRHGISFIAAARIFSDYYRIEYVDEKSSIYETRYNTIGDLSVISSVPVRIDKNLFFTVRGNQLIFVVYTMRSRIDRKGNKIDVIRIISARNATKFERGIYYANL